jgi:hypothetical protein
MRTTRVIALISVISLAMAAKTTIKQKLAEKGTTLAQSASNAESAGISGCGCDCGCPYVNTTCPDLNPADCECTPPPLPILGFPPSNATLTSTTTNIQATQNLAVANLPDNSFTEYENSVCCSCKNAESFEGANATKTRRFCIKGDICVTESVSYAKEGCSVEESVGRASSELQNFNIPNGGLGGGNDTCYNVTVCPLDAVPI